MYSKTLSYLQTSLDLIDKNDPILKQREKESYSNTSKLITFIQVVSMPNFILYWEKYIIDFFVMASLTGSL